MDMIRCQEMNKPVTVILNIASTEQNYRESRLYNCIYSKFITSLKKQTEPNRYYI